MSATLSKIKKAANWLKSISHPTRLEIIVLLRAKKELTVGEICKKVKVEQSLVSHHLASMRKNGILEATRSGINISYSIGDPKVLDILDMAFVGSPSKKSK